MVDRCQSAKCHWRSFCDAQLGRCISDYILVNRSGLYIQGTLLVSLNCCILGSPLRADPSGWPRGLRLRDDVDITVCRHELGSVDLDVSTYWYIMVLKLTRSTSASTSERDAVQLTLGSFFPVMIMSGILWPIEAVRSIFI